jgi:hypothetical protein
MNSVLVLCLFRIELSAMNGNLFAILVFLTIVSFIFPGVTDEVDQEYIQHDMADEEGKS